MNHLRIHGQEWLSKIRSYLLALENDQMKSKAAIRTYRARYDRHKLGSNHRSSYSLSLISRIIE